MSAFEIIAILLTFAAVGSYINLRWFKLPATIGVMAFSLMLSMIAMGLDEVGLLDLQAASVFVNQIDFAQILLHGMLSFLLFAGALHINLADLKKHQVIVAVMATLGVLIATFVTGTIVWAVSSLVGVPLPYIVALLFGALISPTDPVAVLGILKETGMSKNFQIKIGSESLLNDGVAVVAFLLILQIFQNPHQPLDLTVTVLTLMWVICGSVILGLGLGWFTYLLMSRIDDYKTEALLTLALTTGGYALAEHIDVSAPVTMVVAGLVIGNHGRIFGMSDRTRHHLDLFWELLDEILNAILFMLVGLEIMVVPFETSYLTMGLVAILAVLVGRYISVAIPVTFMRLRYRFEKGTIALLTWGGLRGGISIALALSLPNGDYKELILGMTYITVVFSVLFQGTTFRHIARYIVRR